MKSLIAPSLRKLQKHLLRDNLNGKTILHYTGSMFGIGCRISDLGTIQRIVKLKQRDDKSGFIALVPDIRWFDDAGIHIPERLKPLLDQYWPGNLTAVFHCSHPMFENIQVNGKVAFRVPNDDLLRIFIEMLEEPIVSTSVNISTLPAENDMGRLSSFYASWFDFAVYPAPRTISDEPKPSTIIEYLSSNDPANPEGVTRIKCLREGSIPFYGIKKSFEMPMVTFVCTANICRSPIAEKLFNKLARVRKMNIVADSCGLIEGGHMISANSMQLLMEQGIEEAQSHVSKQITPEIVSESWLLLTMEERQRDFIREKEPNSIHKIMTLNEIVGEIGDIKDPYGSELDNYRQTYLLIEDRVNRLLDMINNKTLTLKPGSGK